MSLGITIDFTDPAKLPPLLRLGDAVRRPEIRKVMGAGIADALRDHFASLDNARANQMGGKRTHFYGQVRNAVQQPELVGGDGIKVAINHVGIAQRYFGGTIKPREKQWLAIPARAEAYGNRPGRFNDLHFVFFRRGLAALVQNEQTSLGGRVRGSVTPTGRRKGQTTGGGVFYWLKKEVTQKKDSSVLPSEETLTQAALTEGEAHIKTLIERAQQ